MAEDMTKYDIMEILELEQDLIDDRPFCTAAFFFVHEQPSELLIEKLIKFIRKKFDRKKGKKS